MRGTATTPYLPFRIASPQSCNSSSSSSHRYGQTRLRAAQPTAPFSTPRCAKALQQASYLRSAAVDTRAMFEQDHFGPPSVRTSHIRTTPEVSDAYKQCPPATTPRRRTGH